MTGAQFGYSVAVSGTTIIVGAIDANSTTGAAYIYVRGSSGWPAKPTAALNDPAATANDVFGWSVAVSGTTVIVGDPVTRQYQGSAYIYVKGASGWPTTPTVTLNDPGGAYDQFGSSVSVSGATVVVGALFTDANVGAAYIYVKGASAWPTQPTVTLNDPAATSPDIFGVSVAVSGPIAIVGSPGNTSGHAGAAYVYVRGASGWPTKPRTTLNDPAATGGNDFGRSVAIAGTTAIVGAPLTQSSAETSYVYVRGTKGWSTTPSASLSDPAAGASDQFGYSVAVSGDTAIVGALYTNSGAGAAYIYGT